MFLRSLTDQRTRSHTLQHAKQSHTPRHNDKEGDGHEQQRQRLAAELNGLKKSRFLTRSLLHPPCALLKSVAMGRLWEADTQGRHLTASLMLKGTFMMFFWLGLGGKMAL
jgi:hypothetical protein